MRQSITEQGTVEELQVSTAEEWINFFGPYQAAPSGAYSLIFIAVDYPSFNKSYSVTIP